MSDTEPTTTAAETAPARELPPAAQRALAEAAARRAARGDAGPPTERHGRGGLEPVRYGDWEIKGLAVDF
ncbi:DUF1674 domain-containing protein [Blastochloris viridis]|uniref:DUF1674 domain-containing protein n=1 Tax=Blastochloris viridis TaxID=1079 RepID=A0A0H5BP95_BLAVI|nr:DUF1674 domain-containing protein [Blastochloris viridis]ALK11069.1 hypothetical protein BVIR_3313 [Blastochloris viridis]BAR98943.1 hypothetical protein BV133_1350 [Blastochloris viridis]CUU43731.1 hypothetical protein BVIRIDIS_27570 [Blastochloris viridis]